MGELDLLVDRQTIAEPEFRIGASLRRAKTPEA
jgi:hypothetical protein